MTPLIRETIDRFPEIVNEYFDEEDGSYSILGDLVEWIGTQSQPFFKPDLVNRIVSFSQWCMNQPRGENASDDILSIYTVGFLESLCENKEAHSLVPKLISQTEFINNKEYWEQWVGQSNYHEILPLFKSKKNKRKARHAK